jgi:hypothetical protein
VIAEGARQLDESGEDLGAEAVAATAALDVHRKIDDVIVGVAWIEAIQAAPADHHAALFRDDDRMARLARSATAAVPQAS